MNRNNPKRNRKTISLQNWNYGWAGVYFITICTKKRVHYLVEIENGKMTLSPVDIIAPLLLHNLLEIASSLLQIAGKNTLSILH